MTTPYPLAGAPTFDLLINQFREDSNSQNPSLPPNEFRVIDSSPDKADLTHAASKTNENLYASIALEHGILEIKDTQMTWLPIQGPERKVAKVKVQECMAAVIYTLTPLMTKTRSQRKLQLLLTAGKNKRYYTKTEGALRYVVVDNSEKGLTFAIEPIRLALSESLGGLNK